MIFRLVRPLLYRLDPERAHTGVLALLRLAGASNALGAPLALHFAPRRARAVSAFGLTFKNAVGLAAGYDKDGLAWRGLARLGFGHVEIGTVTPEPQPGNPRPRVFRLVKERSLINRLGFPSRGAEFVAARLRGPRPEGLVVGVNLGKQRDTPLDRAAEDYERLMDRFAALADYMVINVSSPNTPELRSLERRDGLGPLIERLMARKRELDAGLPSPRPLLVKLSPDLAEAELEQTVRLIRDAGIDGVIATNTTISRDGLGEGVAGEAGGLSGAALTSRATEVVRRIRAVAGDTLPIVGCGGVMGGEDARAKLEAGATLVQVYTGLVFEGPALVRRVVEAL